MKNIFHLFKIFKRFIFTNARMGSMITNDGSKSINYTEVRYWKSFDGHHKA